MEENILKLYKKLTKGKAESPKTLLRIRNLVEKLQIRDHEKLLEVCIYVHTYVLKYIDRKGF